MLSELSVSHGRAFPPEPDEEPRAGRGGLLGADYEIANGRYRFRKVYGGSAWWPAVPAPLAVPGVDVKAGEYLLAVRGVDVKPPANPYAAFEDTAGKGVEITVGPDPAGAGTAAGNGRTAGRRVGPAEPRLGGREPPGGPSGHPRAGGVRLPARHRRAGHSFFKPLFYAQLDKDAVILDERYNSGGAWSDYYLDHLRRPFSSYWAAPSRGGLRSPSAAAILEVPKVMLINELAGSGGDGLPWMFRQSKLGPLVGRRTWGGGGRDAELSAAPGRRRRDRPELRAVVAGRGLGSRERGRPAGRRGGTDARGRPCRPGPPAREGHRDRGSKELDKNPPRPPYPVRVRRSSEPDGPPQTPKE